jgi:hypothetical protein
MVTPGLELGYSSVYSRDSSLPRTRVQLAGFLQGQNHSRCRRCMRQSAAAAVMALVPQLEAAALRLALYPYSCHWWCETRAVARHRHKCCSTLQVSPPPGITDRQHAEDEPAFESQLSTIAS